MVIHEHTYTYLTVLHFSVISESSTFFYQFQLTALHFDVINSFIKIIQENSLMTYNFVFILAFSNSTNKFDFFMTDR